MLLLLLALSLQTADAALTCRNLQAGTHRELNPFLGQSCASVVGLKAAATTGVLFLPPTPRRWGLSILAVGGGVGVGATLALDRRD